MTKIWRPRALPAKHNLSVNSDLLRQLLLTRGLGEQSAADKFLAPDYDRDLHDPFLMLDMERAAERILQAIAGGEKIAIFADYDADGVPGAAVLASFFKKIAFANFTVYIPDRHEESYGLNNGALTKLAQDGVKLVITVDCGISDIKPINFANKLGLEVIVTDHHLPPEKLPAAYAIVNPKRVADPYPYKMLAGAGVAFKLVQALATQARTVLKGAPRTVLGEGWEKWLLDLVAIATVADMVPLTGENRALVHFGLKVLRRTPRPGLRRLYALLKLNPEFITEDDIGFLIGPRLNSASRMAHGDAAYALLTAEDEAVADRLARHLEDKNLERRARVEEILNSPQAESFGAESVLVFGDPSWPLGVLGLAASRLAEKYTRPVFVWGENGRGEIRGSCRSDGTVNIVELMKQVDGSGDFFLNYGGHAGAGGFSLNPDRLPELVRRLNLAYLAMDKTSSSGGSELFYDLELPPARINFDTLAELEQLAPFGLANHKPVFYFSRLPVIKARYFGNGARHLELTFAHPDLGSLRAVRFFGETKGQSLPLARTHLDILATLEKSYFRGRAELRLRLVDWREAV